MAARPRRLICVTGTNTEVGKTWVSSRLLQHARTLGWKVAARKPVQSYDASQASTDAAELARATGESPADVCPEHRHYPLALAPPMAADLLGRPRIALQDLLNDIHWAADTDLGLVETVGGLRSPLSHDADSVDLAKALHPDTVLLVAEAGLGTLNAVRLSLACLAPLQVVVFLNRFDANDELHRLNRQWLTERYSIRTVTRVEELALE